MGTVKKHNRHGFIVEESRPIDRWALEGLLEDVLNYLNVRAEGLLDPTLDLECYEEYCSPVIEINLKGYRLATDDEVITHREKLKKDRARKRKQAQDEKVQKEEKIEQDNVKALERAQKVYPELFK